VELTVIIPTRNRCAIVSETLDRLESQAREVACEVIVVDDGSSDDTVAVLERRANEPGLALTLLEQTGLGPATARNRAIAIARAPVCLFIDDDTWPAPGLLARHRDFHARRPEQDAALLGHVGLPAEPAPSPFMRWLADMHLGFSEIADPEDVGGRHFFSGNVSAKTEFVRAAGGFDEEFPHAGHEDIDLGMRLEARGMRLVYDADALVEHYHPVDLSGTLARMNQSGRSLALMAERHPDRAVPRRPGLRHRVKATGLAALALAGVRSPRVKYETWRFLCHEANREAYWDALDRRLTTRDAPREPIRIGRTLARLASRDRDAQLPADEFRSARREPSQDTVSSSLRS
jgi:glycosyltransferase involved in cell wall biosynthesis